MRLASERGRRWSQDPPRPEMLPWPFHPLSLYPKVCRTHDCAARRIVATQLERWAARFIDCSYLFLIASRFLQFREDFVNVETRCLLSLRIVFERQQELADIVLCRDENEDVVHEPVVIGV